MQHFFIEEKRFSAVDLSIGSGSVNLSFWKVCQVATC